MNLNFLRHPPEYAPYIRMQTLLGGALAVPATYIILLMKEGEWEWLAGTPSEALGWAIVLCFLLCLPLVVVCCITGFIVSRLRLRRNASGIILSVVITVATYAISLLFFTLFGTWNVKTTWETIPLLSVITPCAALSALILSAFLPKAPPADG